MSSGGREHFHRCVKCGISWGCTEYRCYRDGYEYNRLCHGGKCVHEGYGALKTRFTEKDFDDAGPLQEELKFK